MNQKLLQENNQPYAFVGSVCYKSGSTMLDNSQQLIVAKAMLQNGKKICIKDKSEVVEQLKKDPEFNRYSDQIIYDI